MPVGPKYNKSSSSYRKPSGLYQAKVSQVSGDDVYVTVPRLTYDFEHGPIAYTGDLPAVDDEVYVGFLRGDQDQLVGIFPGGGQATGPIEASVFVAASNSSPEQKAVADFVCDGVEDELTIQAAYDTGTQLRVVLAEGDYYLKNHFYVENATLEGSGHNTVLWFVGDSNESLFTYQTGIFADNGATIRDLRIDVSLFVGGRMNPLEVGYSFSTLPSYKPEYIWYMGNTVDNVKFTGLNAAQSTPAGSTQVRAFYVDAYTGVLFQNCIFEDLNYHGATQPTEFPWVYGVYLNYGIIRNCVFRGGGGYAYALWLDDAALVEDCQFDEASVLVPASRYSVIQGCRFNLNKDCDSGIITSGPAGLTVQNNEFYNTGTYATESTDNVAGIQISVPYWSSFQGLSYATISHNYFYRCSYDVWHNAYNREVLFDHNTMVESVGVRTGVGHVLGSSSGSYVDCSISNNIITGYSDWACQIDVGSQTDDHLVDALRLHNNQITSGASWPHHIITVLSRDNQGDNEGVSIAGNTITSTSTAPPLAIQWQGDVEQTPSGTGEKAVFVQNNTAYGTFGILVDNVASAYVDKNTLGLYDWDASASYGNNRIEVTGGRNQIVTVTDNFIAMGVPSSTTEAIKVETATGGAVLRNSIVAHGDPPGNAGSYITADGNFYISDNRCYGQGYAEAVSDWASYSNVSPPNDGITIVAGSGGVLGYNSIKSTETNPATTANDTSTRDMFRNVRQTTFTFKGSLTANDVSPRLYFAQNAQVISAKAIVGTAPTGASIIIDLQKNGTTMYGTNTGNRPTILATETESAMVVTPDTSLMTPDQYLQLELLQVGSTIAGADMTVTVYWIPDGGFCPPELPTGS